MSDLNYTPYSEGFVNGRVYEQSRITSLLLREAREWQKPLYFNYPTALTRLVDVVQSGNGIDQIEPVCRCKGNE